jgi:hypothetical protein
VTQSSCIAAGTPLAKPWDLNQTQHTFMFNQSLPGPGKRALRTQLASEARPNPLFRSTLLTKGAPPKKR